MEAPVKVLAIPVPRIDHVVTSAGDDAAVTNRDWDKSKVSSELPPRRVESLMFPED